MATGPEIAAAVTKALASTQSKFDIIKDIGFLISAIGGPVVAIAGMFFAHSRLRNRDSIDLEQMRKNNELQKAENQRAQERHDHDIILKREEIKKERDKLLSDAEHEINNNEKRSLDYLKQLRHGIGDDFDDLFRAINNYQKAINDSKDPRDEINKLNVVISVVENKLEDLGIVDKNGRIILGSTKFDGGR